MFPSPYGVTVIKSNFLRKLRRLYHRFPSPYGVTVIKSQVQNMVSRKGNKFPSPYGVTVIKSKNESYNEVRETVSVPLRGNGN